MGKPTISMAIFNSYVSSPGGITNLQADPELPTIRRSISSQSGYLPGLPVIQSEYDRLSICRFQRHLERHDLVCALEVCTTSIHWIFDNRSVPLHNLSKRHSLMVRWEERATIEPEEKETGVVYLLDNDKREACYHGEPTS